jgi:RimJ/RimL family protein N-acetyltransferase
MIPFTIRDAVPADAAAILDYLKVLAEEPDIPLNLEPGCITITVEEEEKILAGILAADNAVYRVAVVDGEIIGIINCQGKTRMMAPQLVRHVAELGISVRKDWRGKGVGRALMENVIAWAKETGFITRLQLEVYTSNTVAIRLYEWLGFVHEGCRKHAIRREGKYIDNYTMALLWD